jgi:hypothetical protein
MHIESGSGKVLTGQRGVTAWTACPTRGGSSGGERAMPRSLLTLAIISVETFL